ncbi:hypothetical protein B0H11DRAFT_1917027 [Mycena galericulata]|nr:hypothetical protein B0H11DRAFT_1917027 [Mycena galericulata]
MFITLQNSGCKIAPVAGRDWIPAASFEKCLEIRGTQPGTRSAYIGHRENEQQTCSPAMREGLRNGYFYAIEGLAMLAPRLADFCWRWLGSPTLSAGNRDMRKHQTPDGRQPNVG